MVEAPEVLAFLPLPHSHVLPPMAAVWRLRVVPMPEAACSWWPCSAGATYKNSVSVALAPSALHHAPDHADHRCLYSSHQPASALFGEATPRPVSQCQEPGPQRSSLPTMGGSVSHLAPLGASPWVWSEI